MVGHTASRVTGLADEAALREYLSPDLRRGVREVDLHLVDDWNRLAVSAPGGDVHQSREWAEHWARWGWRPRFLRFADGYPILSLERSWSPLPGASAYLPRGPISAGEPAIQTAARLGAAYDYLVSHGVDVVATDAAIARATGYRGLIEAQGFRAIDEIEPSRHSISLTLAADEESVFRTFSSTTRQLVRAAECHGLRIIRYDASPTDGSGAGTGSAAVLSTDAADHSLPMARFYDLLTHTSLRRHFPLAPRARVVDWTSRALAAGLGVYLEARAPDDTLLGGGLFYRHGGRFTYAHAADREDRRRERPGVARLILWRAIQLACREGLTEFDLGGVDIAGYRDQPRPGQPMYGLYAFKKSFGGRWVELSGSHERVARPFRYLAGRIERRIMAMRPRSVAPGA
jgi:peptidoglycan pentaglycine glycine transferase (the first glycine)